MILPIHIALAFANLVLAGILYFYPSKSKLYATYALTAGMLVSGFTLVLSKPATMAQTCIEGLCFLALVSYAMVSARKRIPVSIK